MSAVATEVFPAPGVPVIRKIGGFSGIGIVRFHSEARTGQLPSYRRAPSRVSVPLKSLPMLSWKPATMSSPQATAPGRSQGVAC